jgi:cytoskeletal protein RodZ
MLDDTELDLPEEPRSEPPRRGGNRFVVMAAALGAIMLFALIAIVAYALFILPQREAVQPVLSVEQQTGTALALVIQATDTSTPTQTASSTPSRTNTPRPTNTPLLSSTVDPATATVNALLTQAALAQTQAVSPTGPSPTPGTPTATPRALPSSGFADDIGAPGLLAAAAILLAVIFLARRYRNAE